MSNIVTIPITIDLTNEFALEFMEVVEWGDVPKEALKKLSPEVNSEINNTTSKGGFSVYNYERFTTSNGMNMLRCKPLNWNIRSVYADGTGGDMFLINVGGMGDMVSCFYNPGGRILSIDGVEFDCESFEEAGKQVLSFNKRRGGRGFEETIYVDE